MPDGRWVDTDRAKKSWKSTVVTGGIEILYLSSQDNYYLVTKGLAPEIKGSAQWVEPAEASAWLITNGYDPLPGHERAIETARATNWVARLWSVRRQRRGIQ